MPSQAASAGQPSLRLAGSIAVNAPLLQASSGRQLCERQCVLQKSPRPVLRWQDAAWFMLPSLAPLLALTASLISRPPTTHCPLPSQVPGVVVPGERLLSIVHSASTSAGKSTQRSLKHLHAGREGRSLGHLPHMHQLSSMAAVNNTAPHLLHGPAQLMLLHRACEGCQHVQFVISAGASHTGTKCGAAGLARPRPRRQLRTTQAPVPSQVPGVPLLVRHVALAL